MTKKDLKESIIRDANRWNNNYGIAKLLFLKPQFRLIFFYRLYQYCRSHKSLIILESLFRIIYHHTCWKCGCDIPAKVQIGKGFLMNHSWGVVINSRAVIGEDCTILSGCVIGSKENGIPTIGNNVFIGANAVLLGNIRIGDGAKIGAGAVVTKDVADGAVMIGVPAHNINGV